MDNDYHLAEALQLEETLAAFTISASGSSTRESSVLENGRGSEGAPVALANNEARSSSPSLDSAWIPPIPLPGIDELYDDPPPQRESPPVAAVPTGGQAVNTASALNINNDTSAPPDLSPFEEAGDWHHQDSIYGSHGIVDVEHWLPYQELDEPISHRQSRSAMRGRAREREVEEGRQFVDSRRSSFVVDRRILRTTGSEHHWGESAIVVSHLRPARYSPRVPHILSHMENNMEKEEGCIFPLNNPAYPCVGCGLNAYRHFGDDILCFQCFQQIPYPHTPYSPQNNPERCPQCGDRNIYRDIQSCNQCGQLSICLSCDLITHAEYCPSLPRTFDRLAVWRAWLETEDALQFAAHM